MVKGLGDKRRLIILISVLLGAGFLATTIAGYIVAKSAIRKNIVENELPITSDNVYSEIQKDLVRPVIVASMMADDTFLRDWILNGEKTVGEVTRYLHTIKLRYNAVTSFFVSEKSRLYYHAGGILKHVSESESRDAWYFRVRTMTKPYEINVDPDMANLDEMTIFINYRVVDYDGSFIGSAGVGLTVDAVKKIVNDYQNRYQRRIYFVDQAGLIVLRSENERMLEADIRKINGLSRIADSILTADSGSYVYTTGGEERLLNVRLVPELGWRIFVEKNTGEAISGIRKVMIWNIIIFIGVTAVVLFAVTMVINRFQDRLEKMASTDKLTGFYNRQAFDIVIGHILSKYNRKMAPFCAVMFDIDNFKQINDTYGHLAGDQVIAAIAHTARARIRGADVLCRWGGEEFLLALPECTIADAVRLADEIRLSVSASRISYEGKTIPVNVSAGVAEFMTGESIDSLLNRADQALYRAKTSGKNRVVEYSETPECTRQNDQP